MSSFHFIQSPILGEHLVRVFPPTLVILDDWENDNKVLGCRLLNHLANNVVGFKLILPYLYLLELIVLSRQKMIYVINAIAHGRIFLQTRAELLRQKYDDVAFDRLQRLLYEREATLALEVVKCLAALMAKVDHRYSQPFEVVTFYLHILSYKFRL
jgi:hypothetical protein